MADVVEQVRSIASARLPASYGLEIFDVQYRREVQRHGPSRPDRPARLGRQRAEEGVTVEDCARVSRDLSAVLDVEDVIPAAYTLKCRRLGSIARYVVDVDDYSRFTGRRAKLVMREAVDGQMFFKGRLEGIEDAADCGGRVAW